MMTTTRGLKTGKNGESGEEDVVGVSTGEINNAAGQKRILNEDTTRLLKVFVCRVLVYLLQSSILITNDTITSNDITNDAITNDTITRRC